MKLKTLKDLEIKQYSTMNNPKDFELDDVVSIYELKQEAIKWRNNYFQLWKEWFTEYFRKKTTTKTFGEWLLDKIFNITESDLKESEGGKE